MTPSVYFYFFMCIQILSSDQKFHKYCCHFSIEFLDLSLYILFLFFTRQILCTKCLHRFALLWKSCNLIHNLFSLTISSCIGIKLHQFTPIFLRLWLKQPAEWIQNFPLAMRTQFLMRLICRIFHLKILLIFQNHQIFPAIFLPHANQILSNISMEIFKFAAPMRKRFKLCFMANHID